MSPAAIAIALEAVRGELVEAKQWHAAAQTNLETAQDLHSAADHAMHEAGVRVLEVEQAIAELEQLQQDAAPLELADDWQPVEA